MLGDGAIELYTYSSGRSVQTLLKNINNLLKTILQNELPTYSSFQDTGCFFLTGTPLKILSTKKLI